MMSLGNIKANAKLIGQVPVPKYIFIISITVSNLVNFLLAFVPLVILMLVVGHPISWTILAFPIILIPVYFVTVAISLLLATSHVFFEDTQHLADVGLQALYFLSPVLYHRGLLPEKLVQYLVLNPLFCQVEFMRNIVYDGVLPDLATFTINSGASVVLLIFALWVFKRAENKFLYFI